MYEITNDFIIRWSNGIIWRQFLFRKKKPGIQSLMGLLQQSDITNCFTVIILSLCDVLWYNVFNTTQKKHIRTAIILITFSSYIAQRFVVLCKDYVIILSSLKKCWTEQGVESDLCSAMRDSGSFWEQRPGCVLRSQGVLWWTAVTLKLRSRCWGR